VYEVSVIVVTINSIDDIARNLAELRAQEGVALEIVAVDNDSSDGTEELLAAQPDVEAPRVRSGARGAAGPHCAAEAVTARRRPAAVAFVNGACMLARRRALEEIGGLDERFQLYWEEVDLARRLRDAGWRVLLVPEVEAVHRGKGTPAETSLRRRAYAHGERLYLRKHHGRAAQLAVRAARATGRLLGVERTRRCRLRTAADEGARGGPR
jgi:GT2 family glycosyltransferase